MDLESVEHVYKYYIHHGVSIYLIASRDHVNPELWQVNLKNLYTIGKDLGFGSCPNNCNFDNCYSLGCRNDYCVCKNPIKICKNDKIQQRIYDLPSYQGIDRSIVIRLTTDKLKNLMKKLDTNNSINLKRGNIILY